MMQQVNAGPGTIIQFVHKITYRSEENMAEINQSNYLNYLTYHGRTVDAAWNVVKKWGGRPEYHTHGAIRMWVDASAKVLENAKVD